MHPRPGRSSKGRSSGRASSSTLFFAASAGVLVVLSLLLWRLPQEPARRDVQPLVVYCAAGLRGPVEIIARDYEKACGVPVRLQYGGSQTLLANLEVSREGDLYLPGDDSFIEMAREKELVAERIPLARMTAVLAVPKGNPKRLRTLKDLTAEGVKLAQAHPDAAAIGKVVRAALRQAGRWEEVEKRTVVFKPTVNDVLSDVRLGTVDAGFVWDALVWPLPDLEAVRVPMLSNVTATVSAAVLRGSRQPTAALRFARFLGAADRGVRVFAQHQFDPVEGDPWEETPELVLFSGAMNRVAVEETLQRFEEREGARITRVYNGCGILVGQMKAGARPDAYLTCDKSFVPPVAELFPGAPVELSSSAIVLLAPKGNPRGLGSLADLARPGLRVGVANAEQSTLGALTKRLLEEGGILGPVMSNVVAQAPTADLLVNQMRAGTLDAVVVYVSNTMKAREHLEVIPLRGPGTVAVQTYSIGAQSKHRQLAARLLEALRSAESAGRYRTAGFGWLGEEPAAGPAPGAIPHPPSR